MLFRITMGLDGICQPFGEIKICPFSNWELVIMALYEVQRANPHILHGPTNGSYVQASFRVAENYYNSI